MNRSIGSHFTRLNAQSNRSGFESFAGHFVQLTVTAAHNWQVRVGFLRQPGFIPTNISLFPGMNMKVVVNGH